jgi:hypothetical protein
MVIASRMAASAPEVLMSRDARLMIGITLLLVPTIAFGGLTVLGVLTSGVAGTPGPTGLSALQLSLYRAGHAHAGVLVILSLLLQVFLDHARLPHGLAWSVRVAAPAAALLVSGGFFGLAHAASLRFLLYAGAALVVSATIATGVGVLRSASAASSRPSRGGITSPSR